MEIPTTVTNSIYELGVQSLTHDYYTRYEQIILFRILKFQQQDILESIRQEAHHGQLVFSPQVAPARVKHIEMPLKLLEPCPQHISFLKQSLINMERKPVDIPYTVNGRWMYKHFPQLFTVSFFRKNKRQYVNLHFSTDVLQYYMSFDFGYHKIDLDLVSSFRRHATCKIYQLLIAYVSRGGTRFDPELLYKLLTVDGTYRNYGSMNNSLLLPCQQELKKAYDQHRSNFYFVYSPYYKDEKKGAWPYKITFGLKFREDEEPNEEAMNELARQRARLKFILHTCWKVKEDIAKEIAERLQLSMVGFMDDFLEQQEAIVKRKKNTKNAIRNPAGFIVIAINKFYSLHK